MQWDNTANAGFSTTNTITWLPVHEEYSTNNLAAQKSAEKSTFKLYQKLIKLRKDHMTLQYGGFYSKEVVNQTVFGFVRTLAGEKSVAFLLNLNDKNETVDLQDLFEEDEWSDKMEAKILIVNNDSKLKIDEDVDLKKIELGPYDAIVLEVSSATKITFSLLLVVVSLMKFFF